MRDEIDSATLARYLLGECGRQEAEEIRRWIEADPAREAQVAALREIWRQGPERRPKLDVDAFWGKVAGQMELPVPRAPMRVVTPARPMFERMGAPRRRWASWVAAAAAVVLVAGASWLIVREGSSSAGRAVVAAGVPMREVVTRRGQRAALDLPDGSRVVLAAESRLRIPSGYRPSAGARDVYLEGEAFFEVTHDSARPFRVHTANGIAEDLGTEFVVTAYPETGGVLVAVASGVVALRKADTLRANPAPLLTLTRGDLGQLDASGIATLTRDVNLARYVGWVEGSLVFDGTRLGDVVRTLARWYDLDIRLADGALADRRLTATFRDKTADETLRVLALSLDLHVKREGRMVTLSTRVSP